MGFAAETDDVVTAGRDKLARKGLDLLVANAVGRPATGFGADTNDAAIVAASGGDTPLRTWTKAELAAAAVGPGGGCVGTPLAVVAGVPGRR